MKRIPIFFSALLLVFVLSSCCHKKGCLEETSFSSLHFYGFSSKEELDSVILYQYAKNTNFALRIDSVAMRQEVDSANQYYVVSSEHLLPTDFDYKIKVEGFEKEYQLNNFKIDKRVCNACLFGNDYYSVLVSYQLDNSTKQGRSIQIIK